MTRKEEYFCYELATFMCYPQEIDLGGAAHALKDIIRELTVGNKKFRDKVFEFIDVFVLDDLWYDKKLYGECLGDAIEMMKEDYDVAFFNKR